MRTLQTLKWNYPICFLALLLVLACSSNDGESPIEPEPNGNPNPSENPEPEPEPTEQEAIASVDGAIADFMEQYGVPGAALAVSVDEKMVYAKGYGLSNVDAGTAVAPNDRFRIASISKVFTATAILSLVDAGELSLEDPVFGPNGILGNDFGTATFTADELDITVDHLLMHVHGGWGSSSGGDPIDYQPSLENGAFLEYVLNNWTLAHAPGEAFSYSNMGYWLLSRIIEELSGESYESYLTGLLSPLGITTFKTTTFREDDLEADEVFYYGTASDAPYIFTIASRRDGDGGVVISAPDLLRFLCAIDGASDRPDILTPSSIALLSETSNLSNLGRGLAVWPEQQLTYFTGSLPGNRSWMMIAENGHTATILLNLRRTDTPAFDNDLQALLLNIVTDGSISWQTDLDQF